jgi:hypothetical protein
VFIPRGPAAGRCELAMEVGDRVYRAVHPRINSAADVETSRSRASLG